MSSPHTCSRDVGGASCVPVCTWCIYTSQGSHDFIVTVKLNHPDRSVNQLWNDAQQAVFIPEKMRIAAAILIFSEIKMRYRCLVSRGRIAQKARQESGKTWKNPHRPLMASMDIYLTAQNTPISGYLTTVSAPQHCYYWTRWRWIKNELYAVK